MNENKKYAWLYVSLLTVITAVSVWFQYILESCYLEADSGLYRNGALTPDALTVYLVVAVILILTSIFVMRRDDMPNGLKHGSILTAFTAVVAAAGVAYSSVSFILQMGSFEQEFTAGMVFKLRLVCVLLGFLAAIYYFIVAFSGRSKSSFAEWFSFFPMLWTLCYLLSVYFDHTALINSPIRVIQQLALIVFMVYQLFETRAMIGRAKPSLYFAVGGLAVLFLGTAFIPEIIPVLKGAVKLTYDKAYYLYGSLAMLYVFARMIDFAFMCGGKERPVLIKFPQNDALFTEEEDIPEDELYQPASEAVTHQEIAEVAEEPVLEPAEDEAVIYESGSDTSDGQTEE